LFTEAVFSVVVLAELGVAVEEVVVDGSGVEVEGPNSEPPPPSENIELSSPFGNGTLNLKGVWPKLIHTRAFRTPTHGNMARVVDVGVVASRKAFLKATGSDD
jgi:hypothetical protein